MKTLSENVVKQILLALLITTLFINHSRAEESTLMRLFFIVPSERMVEFEAAYEQHLLPVLQKRGLTQSSERGRATPDSIFSRLFEFKQPFNSFEKSMLEAYEGNKTRVLLKDPMISEALQRLSTAFAPGKEALQRLSTAFAPRVEGLIPFHLSV